MIAQHPRGTGADRLKAALRRLARGRAWPPATAAEAPLRPPFGLDPEQPIEIWRGNVEQRLELLEAKHDATIRRQTVFIIITLLLDLALEIIKRNT